MPDPIMVICQGFAWSRPAGEWGRSRLEIEVTLKSSRFNFIPAINIHAKQQAMIVAEAGDHALVCTQCAAFSLPR
jgi:hypothetical protein